MLGLQHETPSRILRRIQANEADLDDDMPSLPSLPGSAENSLDVTSAGGGGGGGGDRSNGSSMVVRRRPRPTLLNGARGILSPLNANRRATNTSIEQDSPAGATAGKGKGKSTMDSPRSQQQQQQARQRVLPPSTVASTASSTRTVRPALATRRSSTNNKKEVCFSNDTREESSLNLDDSILRSNGKEERQIQDDSSLQGLHLDSSIDLGQLDDSASGSGIPGDASTGSALQVESEEADDADYPTPVPPTSARFEKSSPPSTIVEEQEYDHDEDLEDASLPALPSPASSSYIAADTSEQRLAQHVVLRRRRTNPIVRKSGTVDSPDSVAASTPLPSSSSSSVRQESTIGSTPGIGRRLPSAERRTSGISYPEISVSHAADDATPSKPYNNDSAPPSTGISSRAYPDSNFATPRAASTDADLERRKSHLLSTLRLTALRSGVKPKLKKGTPHPARRARSLTPALTAGANNANKSYQQGQEQEQEQEEDLTASSSISNLSSAASSTSSHDLTTHPRGTGNTSLPLVGGGGGAATNAATRFNGAKLNNYLHTLNTHLSSENQNLVKSLEETAKEVQRLMKKNSELSNRTGSSSGAGVVGEEDGEGDVTREILAGHQKTRDDIEQLREHLTGSTPSKINGTRVEAEHAHQLAELQKQIQERDSDIVSLREQLLAQQNSEDNTNSHLVPELRQQIFSLQDTLSQFRSESSVQSIELTRLRQEVLDSASRNTSAIADLQNRTDELLLQLEERDAIVEEAERRMEGQDEEFKEKMRNLEMELCKVMEEQEGQLRESRREVEELKEKEKMHGKEREEAQLGLADAVRQVGELKMEKERMERLLDAATATLSTGGSGAGAESTVLRERVQLLHGEVAKQEKTVQDLECALQQAKDEASQTARASADEIRDLKDDLDDAETRATQAERKLSTQSVALKETERTLEEAEANLRNAENQTVRLTRQLEEAHSTIFDLQREQVNASFAVLESETQKKLEAAQRELGNLKHQLASPSHLLLAGKKSESAHSDVKDLEIRTLRSSNHELETRVNQLRKQAMFQQNTNNPNSSGRGGNSMMQTPMKGNLYGGATPEKSVRFDSVKSMKTPKSVSEMLSGLSFLDKTDANATISPLYTEIDNLHSQVKKYQSLLQTANEDVDDNLAKLNRAGLGNVDLARELEESRRRIRVLEDKVRSVGGVGEVEKLTEKLRQTEADLRATRQQLSKASVSDNQIMISELRGVKDQLTSERTDLVRRLTDIKQHCHQISSQLDASRTSQAETQRALDAQVSETRRLRQKLESSQGAFSQLDFQKQALVEERNSILQGVAALHRDLSRVQKDAVELGDDLRMARQGEVAIKAPFGSASCTKQTCVDQQIRHREEAKGLLVMIKYLKLKFTRESYLRADLAHQKLYLNMVISQKQKIMDATNSTLARFGMPPSPEQKRTRPTLKIAANAVLSIIRMKRMSEEWRKQSAMKGSLREAYKQTRGKDFPN